MKLQYILVFSALSLLSYSQSLGQEFYMASNDNEESYILVSEDDLVKMVKKINAYKQENKMTVPQGQNVAKTKDATLDVESAYLRQQIAQLEAQLQQVNSMETSSVSGRYKKNELMDAINKQLDALAYQIDNTPTRIKGTTVVVTPQNQRNVQLVPVKPAANNTRDEILILQKKIDSMYAFARAGNNTQPVIQVNKDYDASFNALQRKLAALQNELKIQKANPSEYDILNAKYNNVNYEVFFANASSFINTEGMATVNALYAILENTNNLDIVVKGFASEKGNPKYNENLSMQRTESVKKALIIRGIHPTRVLTQYHGIEYNASTDAAARRVEISFLVRR